MHNGIITNYAVLKPLLERQGAVFVSETDTEVVPHLCEYVWGKRDGRIAFPKLVRFALLWCGVVRCGVVWCGVVWCGVVRCGAVRCGAVRCGAVRCGVVWCGVVWCGVVWCGVVWCGVVWCGVVCALFVVFSLLRARGLALGPR